ncbi:hypothetical protein Pfo_012557 [Paulownia fortunei]|nr:hypothetical protein Pfo_012557 [Paulownia fortunei]
MFLLRQQKLFSIPYSNGGRIIFKSILIDAPSSSSSKSSFLQIQRKNLICSTSSPKPVERASDYSCRPHAAMSGSRPILETLEKQVVDPKLLILRQKLQEIGIDCNASLPGQYNGLICPSCKGGNGKEKCLSLRISEDGSVALWNCFRTKCGWRGTARTIVEVKSTYARRNRYTKVKQPVRDITEESLGLEPLCYEAFADVKSTFAAMNKITKIKQPTRVISEESLGLEPLCNELIAYFAERMISGETLRRNAVMQKRNGDQIAIAFGYRRNEELVSCKYRSITKRFWQESNTEKIFYGLDDIKEASDIIIVEGEMDKLAMEEAGFKNCVSVPDGAPSKVSNKPLPSEKEDTKYHYLWNCKDYTAKASRIILATDGDPPGQALAEELAQRLGRERCWRVKWPKKNDAESFKDANEVLMYMGPDALREVIENSELYQIRGLFNSKDYFDKRTILLFKEVKYIRSGNSVLLSGFSVFYQLFKSWTCFRGGHWILKQEMGNGKWEMGNG